MNPNHTDPFIENLIEFAYKKSASEKEAQKYSEYVKLENEKWIIELAAQKIKIQSLQNENSELLKNIALLQNSNAEMSQEYAKLKYRLNDLDSALEDSNIIDIDETMYEDCQSQKPKNENFDFKCRKDKRG